MMAIESVAPLPELMSAETRKDATLLSCAAGRPAHFHRDGQTPNGDGICLKMS